MEVMNILQARPYQLNDEQKVPTIKNWLGREGLQFTPTFTNYEREACKTAQGLFKTFNVEFKS